MCACGEPHPSFVCSLCAGDPRQDWRMAFELEPVDARERELQDAARLWLLQQAPAVGVKRAA